MATWFEKLGEIALGGAMGAGGLWAVLKAVAAARATTAVARIKEPAELLEAMAAFSEQVNKQAMAITEGLRKEVEQLKGEADQLRGRIAELEEENLQCRGENREMKQRVGSLEGWLRRAGVDIPGGGSAEGALVTIEGDHVTVMKLETRP